MAVVEAAPMSTRLNTLHDEAVHAGPLGDLGLLNRRHSDPDRGPSLVQSIDLRRGRAAESRGDDGKVRRAQHVHLGLVGVVVPTGDAEVDAAPVRLRTQTLGIRWHPGDAGTMTGWREEIDTVWRRLRQERADLRQFALHRLDRLVAGGQKAQTASGGDSGSQRGCRWATGHRCLNDRVRDRARSKSGHTDSLLRLHGTTAGGVHDDTLRRTSR